MCRHLAYLGPPVPLGALLFDPPHSLARQSWAPRDMRGGGTVNADGFGVGWYVGTTAEPVRYRRAGPIWTDLTLPALAASTVSGAVLAAVRSATVGMPVVETASAPFAEGPWLFSLNGVIRGWPDSVVELAGRLPTRDLLTLDASTDAGLLWALVRHRLRAGAAAPEAVAETVREVTAAAPGSRLNLLLTNGQLLVATTVGHALSARATERSVLVCSEPLDEEPGWQPVPDGTLVLGSVGLLELRPIDGAAAPGTGDRGAGPTAGPAP
ncbi:ergothioneine biosynthesis protein EgtC [Plantactinospora sp. S1510]|uniref:Gamma-glutamyl-hercynylcysteine sulfoxide hydrolase n=1 Tax=Plantactinospora alkalitolerans TaxID=2789879 RepID=A0ABS0H0D4_9ACTN|nr:ergothioneine biosynthesis protein EgtC [Plantactinospora alkalitolerans]MBF9131928.1 ergothioneine biosynthesis protein EgtC [Plantactinospora alkalitolerans]